MDWTSPATPPIGARGQCTRLCENDRNRCTNSPDASASFVRRCVDISLARADSAVAVSPAPAPPRSISADRSPDIAANRAYTSAAATQRAHVPDRQSRDSVAQSQGSHSASRPPPPDRSRMSESKWARRSRAAAPRSAMASDTSSSSAHVAGFAPTGTGKRGNVAFPAAQRANRPSNAARVARRKPPLAQNANVSEPKCAVRCGRRPS